jgi:hypothetical protein
MRKGFLLEQCLWIAESGIFCGFCAKGHLFSRVRLKAVPGCIQGKNKIHGSKYKGIIAVQVQSAKVLYLLPMFKHP